MLKKNINIIAFRTFDGLYKKFLIVSVFIQDIIEKTLIKIYNIKNY